MIDPSPLSANNSRGRSGFDPMDSATNLGVFVPLKGGDPIPLLKGHIVIGRRPDCDIQLCFPNVSGRHCELRLNKGVWTIKDLGSTNGLRVNGVKVEKKYLEPGDEVTIARKHHFRLDYQMTGAIPRTPSDEVADEPVFSKSLLERAGLSRSPKPVEFDSDIFEDDKSSSDDSVVD